MSAKIAETREPAGGASPLPACNGRRVRQQLLPGPLDVKVFRAKKGLVVRVHTKPTRSRSFFLFLLLPLTLSLPSQRPDGLDLRIFFNQSVREPKLPVRDWQQWRLHVQVPLLQKLRPLLFV